MDQLFDEWTAYEKIVSNDYMHHRDFFSALAQEIDDSGHQPLSIVDLGCGDCKPVTGLLGRFEVTYYTGIDQSETALVLARKNLSRLGVPFELHCGSIIDELHGLGQKYDLVVCSYSLHHLDILLKQRVLTECRRLLKPGGVIGIIDVFREEGESRQTYIERWQNNARQNFRDLAPAELKLLFEHVRAYDFPESVSTYQKLAETAGFEHCRSVSQDPERLNRLVILY